MANLWQFFGLPDPDAPAVPKKKRTAAKTLTEGSTQQMTLVDDVKTTPAKLEPKKLVPQKVIEDIPAPIKAKPSVPENWTGPLTPDGEAFHDLSNYKSPSEGHPVRALRYVSPDHMNRLPLRDIGSRVNMGDTIIVDLRTLIHMETQSNACRRQLKALSDELRVAIFALDSEDKLLLIPGNDVTVNISKNELGLVPLLL